MQIDGMIPASAEAITERLGFLLEQDEKESAEAIGSYLALRRFYPVFRHVDF